MNDNIYALSPIDKQAAIITSVTNHASASWNPDQRTRSRERLPTMQFTGAKKHDIAGKVYGELTVVGLFLKQNPKKNAQWVVLCKCGYYEVRKRKQLEDVFYKDRLCCAECNYRNELKRIAKQ